MCIRDRYNKNSVVSLIVAVIILWMYKIAIINTNNFLKCNGMVEKNNSLNSYYYNNKIKMYESIDLLDLKYRNVVILKCYFDLSYDEIGYILDLNSDTVKIYFRQSLKNLKATAITTFKILSQTFFFIVLIFQN